MSVIDEERALETLDGDAILLVELARMFSEDAPVALDSLNDARKSNDCFVAHSQMHLIKGLVSTFFAESAVSLAQRLEDALAAGNMAPLNDGGYEELQRMVASMIEHFQVRDWVLQK